MEFDVPKFGMIVLIIGLTIGCALESQSSRIPPNATKGSGITDPNRTC